jgi:hypothetical protein
MNKYNPERAKNKKKPSNIGNRRLHLLTNNPKGKGKTPLR